MSEKMSRRLKKGEVKYISERLREIDMEVMKAFVVKEVDTVEHHVVSYSSRQDLWLYMIGERRLYLLMDFLLMTFSDLFSAHCIGKEQFAGFLADWYQRLATISCDTLSTPQTCEVWMLLTTDYLSSITALERSTVVSAIAAAVYTFFQKQVSYI